MSGFDSFLWPQNLVTPKNPGTVTEKMYPCWVISFMKQPKLTLLVLILFFDPKVLLSPRIQGQCLKRLLPVPGLRRYSPWHTQLRATARGVTDLAVIKELLSMQSEPKFISLITELHNGENIQHTMHSCITTKELLSLAVSISTVQCVLVLL